jgi:hypothetical protein
MQVMLISGTIRGTRDEKQSRVQTVVFLGKDFEFTMHDHPVISFNAPQIYTSYGVIK